MRHQLPPPPMQPMQPQISVTRTKSAVNVNIIATGVVFLTIFGLCVITSFRDSLAVAVLWTGRALAAWVAGWALVKIASGAVGVWHKAKTYGLERQARSMELQERQAAMWKHSFIDIGANGSVYFDGVKFEKVAPFYASQRQVIDPQPAALALPEPERVLDFYRATSGTKQAYKFIAEQRRGKSYLAMHVSDNNRNDHNVVIGTKFEPGEWPNCAERFLSPPLAARGLRRVLRETEERLQPGAVRVPIWRVYLDDWINTVIHHPELAAEFLQVAATQMITAGIVPYFMLQGDSNDDWGNKNSARLKNNFTGLWITGPRDDNGDPIPSQNTAEIVYAGGERLPVKLPAGMPQLGQLPPALSDEERILAAAFNGASYRAICNAAGLSSGGNVNRRIADTLTAGGWVYDGDKGWYRVN